MLKVAIVVLADTESLGDLGRVVNAMEAVKEFKEAGDDIQLVFDGAGTKWIGELSNPDHNYHALFDEVRGTISGACEYCANAFQVAGEISRANIEFMGEYEGHPSFRRLLTNGYQVITF